MKISPVNTRFMAALMELLPGIIHEIASPIAYLQSNTEVIEEQFKLFPDMDADFVQEEFPGIFKDMYTGIDRIQGISGSLKILYDCFSQSADIDTADILKSVFKTAHNRLKYHWKYTTAFDTPPYVSLYPANLIAAVLLSLTVLIDSVNPGGGEFAVRWEYETKIVVFDFSGGGKKVFERLLVPVENLTEDLKNEGFSLLPRLETETKQILIPLEDSPNTEKGNSP